MKSAGLCLCWVKSAGLCWGVVCRLHPNTNQQFVFKDIMLFGFLFRLFSFGKLFRHLCATPPGSWVFGLCHFYKYATPSGHSRQVKPPCLESKMESVYWISVLSGRYVRPVREYYLGTPIDSFSLKQLNLILAKLPLHIYRASFH